MTRLFYLLVLLFSLNRLAMGKNNNFCYSSFAIEAADRRALEAVEREGIKTPYGVAARSAAAEELAARTSVEEGASLYRMGTMGESAAAGGQFRSLEHPLAAGFAERYGIPAENIANANFIESATIKPRTPFGTRPAPSVGANPGGGIEVVVPSGGVNLNGFHTF